MLGFRIWDKEECTMYYGLDDPFFDDIWMSMNGELQSYCDEKEELNFIPMQSTGIKDANGIEIFEADILGNLISPMFAVLDTVDFIKNMSERNYINSNNIIPFYVKGNIHESPELMEKL